MGRPKDGCPECSGSRPYERVIKTSRGWRAWCRNRADPGLALASNVPDVDAETIIKGAECFAIWSQADYASGVIDDGGVCALREATRVGPGPDVDFDVRSAMGHSADLPAPRPGQLRGPVRRLRR